MLSLIVCIHRDNTVSANVETKEYLAVLAFLNIINPRVAVLTKYSAKRDMGRMRLDSFKAFSSADTEQFTFFRLMFSNKR